ncbi:Retinoblastoma-binding protein 5-like [Oopsacas minuta]|uniref:Retinoblastoma-binding protein 5-like n=1 Tax=Oopsacas minuta TaxID=111878 RepID=A0AAV7JC09_9METZ|nr:Retinoblastoma-binding protein 5-like [Oopsacas minuta]
MRYLQVENWSAFAPDFKELEENEEYEERESEFDIEDEDKSIGSVEIDGKSGDESVDISTVQPIPAFCSSDEDPFNDEDGLYWLPTAPEVDDPEDGPGWGQLEPSLSNLENLENISKRPLESPPSPDIPAKKMRTIDIPLPINFEHKQANFKKAKKPPPAPISSSKRSAVRKGKSNRNAVRKKLEKKSGLPTKFEIRKSAELNTQPDTSKDTQSNPTSSYTNQNPGLIEVLDYGSVFKDLDTSTSESDYSSDRISNSRPDSNGAISKSSSCSSSDDSDS